MKVFNFGSINIDHVYRVPHLVEPGETLASLSLSTVLGGKGANQSIALARAGASVCHIGRVGEQDLWAEQQMKDAGVDVSLLESVETPSGHAIIQVDEGGENSIILHGGANSSFAKGDISTLLSDARQGDWLLMQNECNAVPEAFAVAAERQLKIAFNPAPMTDSTHRLPLEHCELLIVNETEACALAQATDPESAAERLSERFDQTRVVITLGAQGAKLLHRTKTYRQNGISVDVVDTTGAGDTFVGYYLAALMHGIDDPAALRRACAASALSVTRQGASPAIPAAAEVDTFLD
ncbi:MAG: ribokinase [Granulosicoccus sp.]